MKQMMSLSARQEMLICIRQRYLESSWTEKGRFLDARLILSLDTVKAMFAVGPKFSRELRYSADAICFGVLSFCGGTRTTFSER